VCRNVIRSANEVSLCGVFKVVSDCVLFRNVGTTEIGGK
jgi:hypothetical protein